MESKEPDKPKFHIVGKEKILSSTLCVQLYVL